MAFFNGGSGFRPFMGSFNPSMPTLGGGGINYPGTQNIRNPFGFRQPSFMGSPYGSPYMSPWRGFAPQQPFPFMPSTPPRWQMPFMPQQRFIPQQPPQPAPTVDNYQLPQGSVQAPGRLSQYQTVQRDLDQTIDRLTNSGVLGRVQAGGGTLYEQGEVGQINVLRRLLGKLGHNPQDRFRQLQAELQPPQQPPVIALPVVGNRVQGGGLPPMLQQGV